MNQDRATLRGVPTQLVRGARGIKVVLWRMLELVKSHVKPISIPDPPDRLPDETDYLLYFQAGDPYPE